MCIYIYIYTHDREYRRILWKTNDSVANLSPIYARVYYIIQLQTYIREPKGNANRRVRVQSPNNWTLSGIGNTRINLCSYENYDTNILL